MRADIIHKTIGEVEILDLMGDFRGTLASRCLLAVQDILHERDNPYSVMITTQRMESMDRQGASVLLENLKAAKKCALITRDTFAAELLLEKSDPHVCVFENTEEGILYLGRELAADFDANEFVEKRKYPRLTVALSAKTMIPLKNDKSHSLLMVVTNLTFNGLFAKFIDSASEMELRKNIDLFDLPLLDFKIRVSNRHFVEAKGKMIHLDLKNQGFGVEFYEMGEASEWLLKKFLDGMIHSESNSKTSPSTRENSHE